MATEKQINYIKNLINDLKLDTMPWVAKLSHLPQKHQEFKIKSWVSVVLGNSRQVREMSYAEIVETYNARLAELENTDWTNATNSEASTAIDNLKNCIVVF